MPPKRRQSASGNREFILKVLTQGELNSIKNAAAVNKLETALRNESVDEIKIKSQKLESDLDEVRHELELTHQKHNNEIQKKCEQEERLKKENSSIKIDIDNLRLQLSQMNSSSLNKDGDLTLVQVEKERIQSEKNNLDLMIKQKNAEYESVVGSYENLTSQMSVLRKENQHYKIQVDNYKSETTTTVFNIRRLRDQLEQAQELYEKTISEIDKKDETIRQLKTGLSEEQRKSSFEFEEIRKDNIAMQKRLDMLDNELEEKSSLVLQITCQNEEQSKEYAEIEQQLQNEVIHQGRLIDLLKERLDNNRCQNEELKLQIEQSKIAMDTFIVENTKINDKLERYEKIISDVELEKKKMSIELNNANEVLNSIKTKGPQLTKEELEGFSPTAAAAVKLMRSGLTLTEMYSEYIEKSNESERLKAENERLNECLNRMYTDIREKLPLIEKQRRQFENAAQMQGELTEQLDEAILDLQIARRELLNSNHSRDRLARENDAFQVQLKTLNKQISILLTNDEIESLTKEEADKFYSRTHEMQNVISKYQAENNVLAERVDQLEADGKEDFEAKLKEMRHLLELEKLERSNIEAELNSIKEQRKTWNAYFERTKDEEADDEESMCRTMDSQNSDGKSPRKSASHAEQKATIKLDLVEQQMGELKEKHEEEVEAYKDEVVELRKSVNVKVCENMKIQSEMKTLDMNVTMKEESLKRSKEEVGLLQDKNNRLMQTMELETKNTSKITEEYVSLREENVKLQIALESSKKRTLIFEDELKQVKANEEFQSRHESGQSLILDTIQQLQQQIAEKEIAENLEVRKELDMAKADGAASKVKLEDVKKELEDSNTKLNHQISLVNKQLEEERNVNQTVAAELQRVKSRQMLGFGNHENNITPQIKPANMCHVTSLEVKQLNDEIRVLKAEKKSIESQRGEFKQISLDVEKRMNSANEEYAKTNIIRDKEVAQLKATVAQKEQAIKILGEDVVKLKNNCGQEDINQLRTKLENAEKELEAVLQQLNERNEDLNQSKGQYKMQLIEHGRAQEEALQLRTENGDMKIKVNELMQSRDVQKARNDSMTKDWEEERESLKLKAEQVSTRLEQENKKNKLLHEQLQTINEQVRDSRRRVSISSATADVSRNDSMTEDQSSLLELTSILRRDQEIAETSREVEHAENIRLKQRIKNLNKQLEETNKVLSDLENLKSRPRITSQQHNELMHQVNQLNILRESNSVLRDEKIRADEQKQDSVKRIIELEQQIEPMVKKQQDLETLLENKNAEKRVIEDSISKLKAHHEEQVKKITATRVSSEQVKKIVVQRDEYKTKFDQKSADYRAKENELNDLKVQNHKHQQQIQILENEKNSLSQNQNNQTEELKKHEETLSKAKKELAEEKQKCDRIRKIAKKYKDSDAAKTDEIRKLTAAGLAEETPKAETSFAEIQTDPAVDIVSEKSEVDLMKKMLQNQIEKLKGELSKKETEFEDKESELQTERSKKEKILYNAKRKINKLTSDIMELRKNGMTMKEDKEGITRPLPEGNTTGDTNKDIAEVKPQQRENKGARSARVAPSPRVAPIRSPTLNEDQTVTPTAAVVATMVTIPVSTQPSTSSTAPATSGLPAPVITTAITTSAPVSSSEVPTSTLAEPEAVIDVPIDMEANVLDEPVVSSTTSLVEADTSVPVPTLAPTVSIQAAADSSEQLPGRSTEGLKRSRSPDPESQEEVLKTEHKKSRTDQEPDPVVEESTTEVVEDPELDGFGAVVPETTEVMPSEEDDLNEDNEPQIEIHAPEEDQEDIEQTLPDSSAPILSRPHSLNMIQQQRIGRSSLPVPTTPSLITSAHGDDDDGCVPRTPTLTTGRAQHEGNQALVSPQVTAQPSNRFTFFGAESEQNSGFGSGAFGASSSGGFSSGFSALAQSSTSAFGSSGTTFGSLNQQRENAENDHSVPGALDGVLPTTDTNQQEQNEN